MNPLERSIRRLERRAFQAVFFVELLRWGAITVFVAGAAVLFARVVWHVEAERTAWLFLLVAIAPVVAVGRARSRRLSRAGAAAWQDVRAGASGLLLTGVEVPDERWREEIEKTVARRGRTLPGVRFGGESYALGAAVVFALLSWWIHVPRTTSGPPVELMAAAVERLAQKLLTLEEDVGLFDETAEELAAEIERLEERLDDATLETAFEAIDRLEKRFADVAERVQEDVFDAEAGLQSVIEKALSDPAAAQAILERTLGMLEKKGLDANLLDSMESLASVFERSGFELPQGLQLPEGLELSGAELMQLSEELQGLLAGKLGALQGLGLLRDMKLFDPANLKRFADLEIAEHECDEDCEKEGT